jgi:hypothetical protein
MVWQILGMQLTAAEGVVYVEFQNTEQQFYAIRRSYP